MARLLPVALLLLTGCGLALSDGPPADHEQLTAFSCTTENLGPILDAVTVGTSLVGAGLADAGPAPGLVSAVVYLVSAIVGFDKSARCRSAKAKLAARQDAAARAPVAVEPVERVVITPAVDTLRVGAAVLLGVTAVMATGSLRSVANATWSSSNDAIAPVTGTGTVTGRAPGTVVIAANVNGVVGTATIVVLSP